MWFDGLTENKCGHHKDGRCSQYCAKKAMRSKSNDAEEALPDLRAVFKDAEGVPREKRGTG
jgi:hypothetical protein